MEKSHILSEIRRTAEANGGIPLGRQKFLDATGIKETDWSGKYWVRWGDAIKEAGYTPQELQTAFPDEYVLEKYAEAFRDYGRPPTTPELKLKARGDSNFPSHNTFGRFGTKQHLINKLHAFCLARESLQDIAELCLAHVKDIPVEELEEGVALQGQEGHVYLIRSGKYFKIGRTNSLARREKELAIQLPEPAETIHSIATDDASGIEAYWHRRFSDKRRNGEWFELTAADVMAFRRRKFM
jgi:Meiotically up-regulated gene 113